MYFEIGNQLTNYHWNIQTSNFPILYWTLHFLGFLDCIFQLPVTGVWWDGSKSHLVRHVSREVICMRNRDGSISKIAQNLDKKWAISVKRHVIETLSHLDFSCIWLHLRHVLFNDCLSHLTIPPVESKPAAFRKQSLLTKVKVNHKIRICLRWKCMFNFFVCGLRGNITKIMVI